MSYYSSPYYFLFIHLFICFSFYFVSSFPRRQPVLGVRCCCSSGCVGVVFEAPAVYACLFAAVLLLLVFFLNQVGLAQ